MIVVGGESGNGLLDDVQVGKFSFRPKHSFSFAPTYYILRATQVIALPVWVVSTSLSLQVLDFDKFTWSRASSKLYLSPSSLPLKIPACKGHGLVSCN